MSSRRTTSIAACALLLGGGATLAWAVPEARDAAPPALATLPVPEPWNLHELVRDRRAAVRLGKALFWDQQVGSDGQACASCHFHAGADSRTRHQVNPGSRAGDATFQVAPVNSVLSPASFPVRANDVVSSQGVVPHAFLGLVPGSAEERGAVLPDPVFRLGDRTVRRVGSRNAPSVFNSVFNARNFWDGSAGSLDARAWRAAPDGALVDVALRLEKASLAAQALLPPLSEVEASFRGRTFATLARKLLPARPLALQRVHPEDSVLGALPTTYAELVRAAFRPEWWSSPRKVHANEDELSHLEANFAVFFGLSIQLYEATLVSDETPYDRWRAGDERALTDRQKQGLRVFLEEGRCVRCHSGALLADGRFHDLGLRPANEDRGSAEGSSSGRATFKTPGLRNVELTGPYFHNGSRATLRQVVELYDAGGTFGQPEVRPLGLSEDEKVALVDFLTALTDPRVRHERAPFDHPELRVPHGLVPDERGQLVEERLVIPAVGARGGAPLDPFLRLDPQSR